MIDSIISKIKYVAFMIVICAVGFDVRADEKVNSVSAKEEIEAMVNRIAADERKASEAMDKVFRIGASMKEEMDRLKKAELSMEGLSGLGDVQQLQVKAERYGMERQVRMKLKDQFLTMYALLEEWREINKRVKEDKRLLELKKKIMMLENTVKEETSVQGLDLTQFEYFDVKKSATLQAISALPEVYGDAGLWNYIYEANKGKVKDPTKPVPAGTVLVVPNIKPSFNLELQEDNN